MTVEGQNSTEDNRLTKDPRYSESGPDWQGAVLLKNEIEYYASLDPPLIKPLDVDFLKPASYLLRLGKECRVNGEEHNLSDEDPELVIPPHGLAIVSTLEELNVPGFLIGRWNLRVSEVYEGLLWVGGAQVDPGYHGHLYCPVYNLTTRPVEIKFQEPLFAIDFVKTTSFVKGISTLWQRKREDRIGAHDTHYLKSAVSEELKKVDEKASRIEQAQHFMLLALAIIVAAVTTVAMLGVFGRFEDANSLSRAAIGVSGVAMLIAIWALSFNFIRRKRK